ncbi:MAG: ABC transporter substrate-binding protein [Rubrivivax sp.]|nr:ABC transporter substrate-binding protein [Rubrivivax sp.]
MTLSLTRRQTLLALGTAPLLAAAGCASRGAPAPAVVAGFAPTGRLRACINLGNPILARRDAATQQVSGVSVDLAHRLGARLGLAVELVVVEAAARSVETVRSGQADIGFFAVDPARSQGVRFSAPYVQIEGAYLVRQASPLTDNTQVDRAGTRIMVGRGSAYDLYLSRELKAATLMRTPTSPQVVAEFLAQNADVAAGVKQQLEKDLKRVPGLRLLPGRFMVIEQAMGVQAGRGEAVERELAAFVEEAKASGFVAEALKRHGIQGAGVAPPARA